MSPALELPYSSTMANPHEEKVTSARESARVLVEAIAADRKPRDLVTRAAIENAVAVMDHHRVDQRPGPGIKAEISKVDIGADNKPVNAHLGKRKKAPHIKGQHHLSRHGQHPKPGVEKIILMPL